MNLINILRLTLLLWRVSRQQKEALLSAGSKDKNGVPVLFVVLAKGRQAILLSDAFATMAGQP